ncbi:hypothetical protein A462_01438 [Pseudomonas sp. Ag1]|nr:hypothetical protein A462_01438 [Pseudomonas sp. Ag1]
MTQRPKRSRPKFPGWAGKVRNNAPPGITLVQQGFEFAKQVGQSTVAREFLKQPKMTSHCFLRQGTLEMPQTFQSEAHPRLQGSFVDPMVGQLNTDQKSLLVAPHLDFVIIFKQRDQRFAATQPTTE